MRRAFVFTADALFALMLLSSVAMMFSIYSTQTEYASKTSLLQALAYDYVTLNQSPANLNASVFKAKTGLDVYTLQEAVPSGRQIVAVATRYGYNSSCNAVDCGRSCRITKGMAAGYDGYGCLLNQTLSRFEITKVQAQVATP